jgi:predicted ATPase/DNA-binding CsgD family transcriptional regulator
VSDIGGVPFEHSSFVGRRNQLAAARAELGATRLLTLTGPGGVGKTRFAVNLVYSIRRLHPGGVWFIDLSRANAAGSVANEVGRIVGAQVASHDALDAVSQVFGGRRGLLVLDNCEQVVDECARLIRRILDRCPEMTVITTSRAALRMTSETIFVVEPLATDEPNTGSTSPAVILFLDRCSSVLPRPTAADLETIAEICRRLDGLPLAIELAASRMQTLSPAQILERLIDPLAFLTGGNRDVPDRQRTMRATIAISYEICTEEERALWRRMSVFAGGWDIESAEWMSAGRTRDDLIIDLVQSLLEKSVIIRRQTDGIVYYDTLNAVRMFGLEVTTADELTVARALQRDWYLYRLAVVEADWYGPNQAYWLSLTRRELPNIRTVLDFCIAHEDGARAATVLVTAWRVVWQAHGYVDDLLRWCARVVDLGAPATPEICQVITILGGVRVVQGDTEAGVGMLELASELADELGDDFSRALVCATRASVGHDPEEAIALYTQALELLQRPNLMLARANVEHRLAIAHDEVGNAEIAGQMVDALIARAQQAGESFEIAALLCGTGSVAARRGELYRATSLLRRSLALSRQLGDHIGVALVQERLANVAARSRNYARAATLLGIANVSRKKPVGSGPAFPPETSIRSEIVNLTRRALGPRNFAIALATGEAMTMEEGIAYALDTRPPALPARTSRASRQPLLSPRERQVSALVGHGLSDQEIADRLVISRRTAEGHVANSLAKLGFSSRTQLAVWSALESVADPP